MKITLQGGFKYVGWISQKMVLIRMKVFGVLNHKPKFIFFYQKKKGKKEIFKEVLRKGYWRLKRKWRKMVKNEGFEDGVWIGRR